MTNSMLGAACWLALAWVAIPQADAAEEPPLVEPAIVVDADTGSVLHAEAVNRRWAPASLTKLMTLYLAFEAMEAGMLSGDEPLTVSKAAAGQPPTRLGLRAGETLSAADAITAVATASANRVRPRPTAPRTWPSREARAAAPDRASTSPTTALADGPGMAATADDGVVAESNELSRPSG